jgi:hypothetical protein
MVKCSSNRQGGVHYSNRRPHGAFDDGFDAVNRCYCFWLHLKMTFEPKQLLFFWSLTAAKGFVTSDSIACYQIQGFQQYL